MVNQLAEKRSTTSEIYPGKIFYAEDNMAVINMTYEDMLRAAKGMQNQYQQNLIAQNQGVQGLAGLGLGQLGGQLPPHLNPYAGAQSPPRTYYPNGEAFTPLQLAQFSGVFNNPKIKAVAEHHGFVIDFDTDCYKHPNGGFVSKRMLEDCNIGLHELFKRAKSPNIHWLDDRIEEIRFKL